MGLDYIHPQAPQHFADRVADRDPLQFVTMVSRVAFLITLGAAGANEFFLLLMSKIIYLLYLNIIS